jgi:hypothetical protein
VKEMRIYKIATDSVTAKWYTFNNLLSLPHLRHPHKNAWQNYNYEEEMREVGTFDNS